LEKTVLVLILLGVFVGSVSSMTSISSRVHPKRLESGQAMIAAKDRSLELTGGEAYVEVGPPEGDAFEKLGIETTSRTPEALIQEDNQWGALAVDSSVSHLGRGILVNDLSGGGVLYVNYSVVMVKLPPGGNLGDAERAVQNLGGVLIDEWEERMAVLLPSGALGQMDDLVAHGAIESFEAGGFGSGFGKA